ncbi:hypothetical protein [Streptomyces sp. HGB0020]|uniref:hypothetical protein n=1 Tax=Streptomyces sp. HGB0020 TaxID=1078086 RepID=UPI00034E7A33|nr:hypothetical protein [Streptomyces sp. HGB0020]EPD63151.1 hypothetical protein HMPREF1211_03492 [Streptomyces sp. HGB0020]
MIYGTIGGGGATTGALAATGAGFNTLAEVVATTTLIAAGLALHKLAPRLRRRG